jgi:hypothetical protein
VTHISIEALAERIKGIDRAQALALVAVLADAGVCQMDRHVFHAGCEHHGVIFSMQAREGVVAAMDAVTVCPYCGATIDVEDLRFEIVVRVLDEVEVTAKKMHAFTRLHRKGATPRFYAGRPVGGGGQLRPGDRIEVILNNCLVQGEFVTRGNHWFAGICLDFEVDEFAVENHPFGECARLRAGSCDVELPDCVLIRKVPS